MARTPNPYTKLGRRAWRRTAFGFSGSQCQLWLGADHLLAVDYTISTEEYRRFYFRDIEAIVIRRTVELQVSNWIMGVLAAFTAGPFFLGWLSERSSGLLIASVSIAVFWTILIAVNSLRGATCRTQIRTAAQAEYLPSLGRLPAARKALARLRPLIAAAQGEVTVEELAAAPWV